MTVHILVHEGAVDVQITGLVDRALCMSSGAAIPMDDVVGARLAPYDEVAGDFGWRLGGAYLPGVVTAGWYGMADRARAKQLAAVFRDRDEVLVIDTKLERPARIVVSHPDRERLAWWINERVDAEG